MNAGEELKVRQSALCRTPLPPNIPLLHERAMMSQLFTILSPTAQNSPAPSLPLNTLNWTEKTSAGCNKK